MKKIAILSAVNIKHMSLISLYTDLLKTCGIEYDIIYMDKYNEDEEFECRKKYRYVNVVKPGWPRIIKEIKYMMFLPYATRILNKNKYDFVIVWNDVAIFIFAWYLSRKYKGKYCLNVRDDMGYTKPSRQKRYDAVFRNAAFITISSKGFLDFLPTGIDYIPVHSLNLSVLAEIQRHNGIRQPDEPIRIGFIGYVRYFERNQKLLDVFANDSRFELHYYGTHANVLKDYSEVNGIKNTIFHDSFPVGDTAKYLGKIDIINNLYGNDTINVRLAISIKFFHALYARIPILVSPDTYVGEIAKGLGFGFEVSDCCIDINMKNNLYKWYHQLSFNKLEKRSADYLAQISVENDKFSEIAMKNFCD
ncbi:hypothetical protein SpiGrapes_1657 [Sphaerochaeta pleomorpha str. Grapes]|uniref:Glycosyltransferase n=1 Tax=Sphaerochaeta pleomorpha (strain ATCC BAA-1885 / DSM 22778 / Grapes) TaxID=158190 RepID=G8QWV6_SPHPG|nr:hypothetical protein [Sphaerochaeta pleomorpha]AEV29460.1 hypothetical protein SpiGrapes_1657 [Sphaerochaeta pleomorpha str. Grapes]